MNIQEYNAMYEKRKIEAITEKEWKVYCDSLLDKFLQENKEVLERLAHL